MKKLSEQAKGKKKVQWADQSGSVAEEKSDEGQDEEAEQKIKTKPEDGKKSENYYRKTAKFINQMFKAKAQGKK